jgi:hypothetical protein
MDNEYLDSILSPFHPSSLLANGEASKQQRRHGDKHRAEAG